MASKQRYKNISFPEAFHGTNMCFDNRGLFGRDFDLLADMSISPYIGLGFRAFRNQAGKALNGLQNWGHLSSTNYLYAPLGFDAKFLLVDLWTLTFNGEIDVLLNATIRATRFATKMESSTGKGLGLRTSLALGMDFASFTVEGKPYYRYWSVDAAGHKCGFCGKRTQPKHKSQEIGFSLGVKF